MAKINTYPNKSAVAPSSFLQSGDFVLAGKAAAESTIPAGVYRATIAELAAKVLAGSATSQRTHLYYGTLALTPKNNANKAVARASAQLLPLAQSALGSPSARTSKSVGHMLYSGALVSWASGAAAGYYCPWLAIESARVQGYTLLFQAAGQDDTGFWSRVSSETLLGTQYDLYVRSFPLLQNKTLRGVINAYE